MKYINTLSFKMVVSGTVALAIGNILNIQYATVAATIAILSIQDTRKKSLVMAYKRLIAGIVALLLSYIPYSFLGHNAIAFGVFLLILIPILKKFNIEEGTVPAVVLSTHLLGAGVVNFQWVINEVAILLIGIGTASIANLYMPSLTDKFNEDKEWIEEKYRIVLYKISKALTENIVDIDEEKVMLEIEKRLIESTQVAYRIVNNNFFKSNTYYTDYINMRINQFDNLKDMRARTHKFIIPVEQMILIGKFSQKVSQNISEMNDCSKLLQELKGLHDVFKNMELPKSREEFESRAQAIHYIDELEGFLKCKKNYCEALIK